VHDLGVPEVQMLGEVRQTIGCGRERLADGLVEAYPDGELDEDRAEAAQRVESGLTIDLQSFLRLFLSVVGMLGLNLFQSRCQIRHLLGVLGLLNGQGQHEYPDDDSEDNDAQPKIVEKDVIQQHQAVDHRPEYDCYPAINEDFQALLPIALFYQ